MPPDEIRRGGAKRRSDQTITIGLEHDRTTANAMAEPDPLLESGAVRVVMVARLLDRDIKPDVSRVLLVRNPGGQPGRGPQPTEQVGSVCVGTILVPVTQPSRIGTTHGAPKRHQEPPSL
jgi:hypothetical protein